MNMGMFCGCIKAKFKCAARLISEAIITIAPHLVSSFHSVLPLIWGNGEKCVIALG